MIYSEKEPSRNWIWWIFFAFILLITPQISSNSLNKNEAILGSIAYYFQFSHQYLTPLIQGQEVDAVQSFFPSLLMSLFSQNVPVEFLVRFHSFIASFFLALLTANFTRKYSERRSSAIVAGLCVFSTLLSVRFSAIGDLRMISVFFVSFAWVILFEYGSKKEWTKAWIYSLSILFFAFLLGGIYYVFCFYLPLIFMRQGGFNTWRRLWHLKHLLVVGLISGLFFSLWFLGIELFQNNDFFKQAFNERITIAKHFELEDLWGRFPLFPFKAVGSFIPWIIFAWPIFCQSYRRVEEKPILFTYLRTISISIFFFVWLTPQGRIGDLLIISLPLAVMTGFHYPVVIRRYSNFFRKMIRFIFAISTLLSFSLIIYYSKNLSDGSVIIDEIFVNFILMTITFLLSLIFFLKKISFSVIWQPFFLSIIFFHWCYTAITNVNATTTINYKKNGSILRKQIPEESMVFNLTDKLYIRQMFYLGRPVSRIFPDKEILHKVVEGDTFESLAFRYYGNVKLAKKLSNLNFGGSDKTLEFVKIPLPKEVYVAFYDTKPINLTANASDYNWKVISPVVKTNDGKHIQIWFGTRE